MTDEVIETPDQQNANPANNVSEGGGPAELSPTPQTQTTENAPSPADEPARDEAADGHTDAQATEGKQGQTNGEDLVEVAGGHAGGAPQTEVATEGADAETGNVRKTEEQAVAEAGTAAEVDAATAEVEGDPRPEAEAGDQAGQATPARAETVTEAATEGAVAETAEETRVAGQTAVEAGSVPEEEAANAEVEGRTTPEADKREEPAAKPEVVTVEEAAETEATPNPYEVEVEAYAELLGKIEAEPERHKYLKVFVDAVIAPYINGTKTPRKGAEGASQQERQKRVKAITGRRITINYDITKAEWYTNREAQMTEVECEKKLVDSLWAKRDATTEGRRKIYKAEAKEIITEALKAQDADRGAEVAPRRASLQRPGTKDRQKTVAAPRAEGGRSQQDKTATTLHLTTVEPTEEAKIRRSGAANPPVGMAEAPSPTRTLAEETVLSTQTRLLQTTNNYFAALDQLGPSTNAGALMDGYTQCYQESQELVKAVKDLAAGTPPIGDGQNNMGNKTEARIQKIAHHFAQTRAKTIQVHTGAKELAEAAVRSIKKEAGASDNHDLGKSQKLISAANSRLDALDRIAAVMGTPHQAAADELRKTANGYTEALKQKNPGCGKEDAESRRSLEAYFEQERAVQGQIKAVLQAPTQAHRTTAKRKLKAGMMLMNTTYANLTHAHKRKYKETQVNTCKKAAAALSTPKDPGQGNEAEKQQKIGMALATYNREATRVGENMNRMKGKRPPWAVDETKAAIATSLGALTDAYRSLRALTGDDNYNAELDVHYERQKEKAVGAMTRPGSGRSTPEGTASATYHVAVIDYRSKKDEATEADFDKVREAWVAYKEEMNKREKRLTPDEIKKGEAFSDVWGELLQERLKRITTPKEEDNLKVTDRITKAERAKEDLLQWIKDTKRDAAGQAAATQKVNTQYTDAKASLEATDKELEASKEAIQWMWSAEGQARLHMYDITKVSQTASGHRESTTLPLERVVYFEHAGTKMKISAKEISCQGAGKKSDLLEALIKRNAAIIQLNAAAGHGMPRLSQPKVGQEEKVDLINQLKEIEKKLGTECDVHVKRSLAATQAALSAPEKKAEKQSALKLVATGGNHPAVVATITPPAGGQGCRPGQERERTRD